ncbi:MAG TPA: LLM class F420-dependent oxidoreductase [Acidimicrobiia bacterium]
MKVDGGLVGVGLEGVGERAQELEAAGYDGAYTFEGPHDPFLPLLLAAEHTERIELSTAIAIAFARNPMTLANIGYDLQLASGGRFALGLGSQIKPHIEKRFSMPWSAPAARMRELVLAIKAIWACWQDGTPLRFEGEFYRHTLMTPFFDPGPNPAGVARIWLAGVGPTMTEVAGEVADGFIVHPFSTERFLREVTLPALERGFAKSGRTRADFEISFPLLVVTGESDEELAAADAAVRAQMGFYGSTPAYARVLELHGWGDVHPELNRLSKTGGWAELGSLVTDEMVEAFAVRGTAAELPGRIHARYGDLIDRVSFNAPYRRDPERWAALLDGFRSGSRT